MLNLQAELHRLEEIWQLIRRLLARREEMLRLEQVHRPQEELVQRPGLGLLPQVVRPQLKLAEQRLGLLRPEVLPEEQPPLEEQREAQLRLPY